MHFAYGAITLWGIAFQRFQLCKRFVTFFPCGQYTLQPHYPKTVVWAFPFSLAATRGITRIAFHPSEQFLGTERNSYCYLFLRVLRCFTSPGALRAGVTPRMIVQHYRVSPFGHLRITGYKPPPRSFSQVSRVLLSRPRPRHPPCTLTVSRTETYIPQSLFTAL